MEWVLIIFMWNSDAMTSQRIEMYDKAMCEAAAVETKLSITNARWPSVRVWTACVQVRGKR